MKRRQFLRTSIVLGAGTMAGMTAYAAEASSIAPFLKLDRHLAADLDYSGGGEWAKTEVEQVAKDFAYMMPRLSLTKDLRVDRTSVPESKDLVIWAYGGKVFQVFTPQTASTHPRRDADYVAKCMKFMNERVIKDIEFHVNSLL